MAVRRPAYLAGLASLSVAALLLFTLAEFTRRALRHVFAGVGTVATLTAAVLFILLGRSL